jgi:hypothetical protein
MRKKNWVAAAEIYPCPHDRRNEMKRILQGVIMSWGLLMATLAGAVSLPTTKDA